MRGDNTADTATSRAKKSESPVLKAIKRLIDILQADNNQEANTLVQNKKKEEQKKVERQQKEVEKQRVKQEIKSCLSMAKECGATGETDEFFMATILFLKKYNRTVFCKFTTNEGRLGWLKMCYRDWCR
jgi:excinuclease UvrABC helicase subunit UvrB